MGSPNCLALELELSLRKEAQSIVLEDDEVPRIGAAVGGKEILVAIAVQVSARKRAEPVPPAIGDAGREGAIAGISQDGDAL
jgi:hypothetical protein